MIEPTKIFGGFIMALNLVQIGKRVRESRKRCGLSQQELSENIDRSPTYISYIENGLKCMSLDTFVSIANVLHVSADELLKDSIENTVNVFNHEFSEIASDCSEYERHILLEVALVIKNTIRENRHLLLGRQR